MIDFARCEIDDQPSKNDGIWLGEIKRLVETRSECAALDYQQMPFRARASNTEAQFDFASIRSLIEHFGSPRLENDLVRRSLK